MPLRLYNTLTRQLEDFEPRVKGRVCMYTCGPTVWNYAHIGNFRTFLFEDLLRRWLRASGFQVFQIMNLTDVDDRIIREAGARGIPVRDFTEPFAAAFHEDRRWLRIQDAESYPRATDWIPAMIDLVSGLLQNGTAYRGDDGSVYFAIARFPDYGRLSQLDRRELRTGASGRVASDEYDKENAQDFALWKAAKPEDERVGAAWDAPFGRGRPGWHLECSAMALALLREQGLGPVLDIHAGGVDLIFPHHEDEIAQSCAYTGEKYFARYWLHGEFLNVRGTKMSKRFGNVTTPRDLKEDGVDPGAIRLLMCQTHYRQRLDLTDEALAGAREGSKRLGEFDRRLHEAASDRGSDGFDQWASTVEASFGKALDDDLNAPQGMAAIFAAVKEGNRLLDQGLRPTRDAHVVAWDRVVGVVDVLPEAVERRVVSIGAQGRGEARVSTIATSDTPPADPSRHEEWARQLAQARLAARGRRDFAEADRIRDVLRGAGWEVRDNKDGTAEVRPL
jgi:cysteinyl-tRNA synthetase